MKDEFVTLKFPIQVNDATGKAVMSDLADSVRESIYLILMTQQGERLTRPDFGSRIMSYAFMDVSQTRLTMLKMELTNLISEQEPRADDVEIEVIPDLQNGRLLIDISYVIGEKMQDQLLFPFYLQEQNAGRDDR